MRFLWKISILRSDIMSRGKGIFWGCLFIILGLVFIFVQVDLINIQGVMIPATIFLGLAILFHIGFIVGGFKNPGLLVPGGILLVYAAYFVFLYIDPNLARKLWPLVFLGPALGLLELKVFSKSRSGSWIPIVILLELGAAFMLQSFTEKSFIIIIIAATFITAGITLLATGLKRKKKQEFYSYTKEAKTEDKPTEE